MTATQQPRQGGNLTFTVIDETTKTGTRAKHAIQDAGRRAWRGFRRAAAWAWFHTAQPSYCIVWLVLNLLGAATRAADGKNPVVSLVAAAVIGACWWIVRRSWDWKEDLTFAPGLQPFTIENRGGLEWGDVPGPLPIHRCRPWSRGRHPDPGGVTWTHIERCRCGARRVKAGDIPGPWTDRNSRKDDES